MSTLTFRRSEGRARAGLKGPRAAEWLRERGIALPPTPNTWTEVAGADADTGASTSTGTDDGHGKGDDALLVARLGASEFFLEGAAVGDGATVRRIAAALETPVSGIYPVLREDAAFVLAGDGALDVLAQVCNVNFAALDCTARPVIMTLMIGVAVLIVPQAGGANGAAANGAAADGAQYRIWCDPTFGEYLEESVGTVVLDCGGTQGGVSA